MKNNDNFFNIFNYLKSKLEKEPKKTGKVIVCLDEDNEEEPYIDIIYIDPDEVQASMTSNFEKLNEIGPYADEYSEIFDTYPNDDVISVVYDTGTDKLNLIRTRNGNYIGDKLWEDFETPIFVGYIIKSGVLSREEKILLLYDVMKSIMNSAYIDDLEEEVIFKVKDEALNNVYYERTFKEGSVGNSNEELLNQGNLSVIENVFEVKLIEGQIQKTKK